MPAAKPTTAPIGPMLKKAPMAMTAVATLSGQRDHQEREPGPAREHADDA